MGVVWHNCDACDEVTNDHVSGEHEYCGTRLCEMCYDKAVEKYGKDEDGHLNKCPCCDKTIVKDSDCVKYLLKKLNMTMDEVKVAILKKRGVS